jgi:DNA replication protein DnaC
MQNSIISKMQSLHLRGMASYHQSSMESSQINQYTASEYIEMLVQAENDQRHQNSVKRLKKNAKFRTQSNVLDIDYNAKRGLDKMVMKQLLTLDFIVKSQNVLLTGATGTGKSYIAQSIGIHACEFKYKVIYFTMNELKIEMEMQQMKGTLNHWIKKLQQANVLILDDFGLAPITDGIKQLLMNVIDFKYQKSTIIISSQIPVSKWHDLFNEPTIADAIMDRIVHNSHRIELDGESMRKIQKI